LGLHCLSLELELPDGQPLSVQCPLFDDQYTVFSSLPWWQEACALEPILSLPPISASAHLGVDHQDGENVTKLPPS
jgi:hypothetical protein